jgi:hypothetical protein
VTPSRPPDAVEETPSRSSSIAATPAAQAGANTLNQIGCAICHVTSITTAPAGTVLNVNVFAETPETQVNVVSEAPLRFSRPRLP